MKSEDENETTHFIFNYVIHIFMLQFTSTFLSFFAWLGLVVLVFYFMRSAILFGFHLM